MSLGRKCVLHPLPSLLSPPPPPPGSLLEAQVPGRVPPPRPTQPWSFATQQGQAERGRDQPADVSGGGQGMSQKP